MGRGRAPCCDKSKVKRGPWSPAEDLRLITFIHKHGHENWRALPTQAGLLRCGKSCRLRWINYLRPDVKRGNFTQEEEETILKLHESLGNKWSKIASHFPGRTDNEIKNVWNTHLKKRLGLKNANPHGDEPKESSITSSSSSSSSSPSMSYGHQNMGTQLGDQAGRGSMAKRPCEVCKMNRNSPANEAKEPSNSSSSFSSNTSDVSNSSQVDVSRPEEQMGSLFTFRGPYEVHNKLEEVNNQEISDEAFEIPLESDLDFWNMLDNFGNSFQPSEAQLCEFNACQSLNFREEYTREVESGKWLRYLENELGLEETREESQEFQTKNEAEQLVPKTFGNEISMKPEIDPTMAYFQMWASSAHTSTK